MGALTQRELLCEGILSSLRKGIAGAAKGAAAVGGALKSASDAGTRAKVGDLIRGGKEGWEKEKDKQKTMWSELDSTVEELGYYKFGEPRGKGPVVTVDVADLDYNNNGEKIPGKRYSKPLVLKWDKENKSFKTVRGPKGSSPRPRPKPVPPKPKPVPPKPKPDAVTISNFKEKLKEFTRVNKHKWDPSNHQFNSKLAVSEFVRSLAKKAGNSNWYKNIPHKLGQIKKDRKAYTNDEMMTVANQLKFDGIIKESQKKLLVSSRLLCDGFASMARAIARQRNQQRAAAAAPAPAAEPAPAPATAEQPAEEPDADAPTPEDIYERQLAFYDKHLDLYKGDDDISKKQREIVQGLKDKIERRGPLQNTSPESRKESWAKLDAMEAKEAQDNQRRADERSAREQAHKKKMDEIRQAGMDADAAKGMSPDEIDEKQRALGFSDKNMSPEEKTQFNVDAVKAGNQKGVEMADSYERVAAQIKEDPASWSKPPAFDGETGRKFTDEEKERFQRLIDQYSAQRKEEKERKAHWDDMKQQAMDQMGVSPAQWDAAMQKQRAKAGNAVTQQAEGTSQKNLLRQLTLLSG